MAERKSGPVKPPVIDLKAREASQAPAGESAAEPAETLSKAKPPGGAGRPKSTSAAAPAGAAPEIAGEHSPAMTPEEARASAEAVPPATEEPEPNFAPREEPRPPEPEEPVTRPEAPRAAPQTPIPPPPRPQARLAMPWSAISIAAVAGALLGTGITYLAASWIALPTKAPPFADPTPAIEQLTGRAAGLEQRLSGIEETALDTRVGLDATVAQLDSGLAEMRQSVADLREAIPEPQAVDLTGIEEELRTLESRVAAIAAGASSADASALAENLVGIEQNLASLNTKLADFEGRIAATDTAIDGLGSEVEAAKAAIAAQSRTLGGADIGPAVRLPLIVSGLETAFASGRPYAAELASLTSLLPDLPVPAAIAAAAPAGLARPDALVERFNAALPDIIAGRAAASSGDWAEDAVEWAKALLALRPAEEMEGDSPEAIISRLEGAMDRRDFVAAAELLAALPEPMQRAAGEIAGEIATLAEAETFVAGLRAQALEPAAEEAT